MPTYVLTSNTFDSIPVLLLSTDDIGVVVPGIVVGSLSSAQSINIAGSDVQVSVSGAVSGAGTGILAWDTNSNGYSGGDIVIGETGSVVGGSGPGADIRLPDVSLTNHGVLEGPLGVDTTNADGLLVHNHGRITGRTGEGVRIDGNDTTVYNAGLIEGTLAINTPATVSGARVFNTGTLIGRDNHAVNLASDNALLVNHGEILSTNTGTVYTIEVFTSGANGPRVENHGQISALNGLAVRLDFNTASTLTNTGLIDGAVFFGSAGDVLRNSGRINSDIDMQAGNDRFDTRGGVVDGVISGNTGNDTLIGGDHADIMDGAADNDILRGYGGDDTLLGNSGFDTLYGNGGDDSLDGGGRTDKIYGGKGNDTMTGGGGGDVFVIRRVGNGDDEVTDFQNGGDVVDISALGVQNFNALNNSFNALSQTTDGVLVDLAAAGGSGSILLIGVTLADMDASDFIF